MCEKSVRVSKPEVWDSKDLGDKRRMNFKFCTEAKIGLLSPHVFVA